MVKLTIVCVISFWACFASSAEVKTSLLPGTDVCGKQKEERIYGGEEAGLGEFPWLVLLGYNMDGTTEFMCGGALINNRYVLTAAHCMLPQLTSVRLGEHDINKEEDCEGDTPGLDFCTDPPVDLIIEDKIVHESYDNDDDNGYGDIALLRLEKEVNYTDFIKPICLPLSSEFKTKVFAGQKVTVSGWGKTEKKSDGSNVKLKVEIPMETNQDCAEVYKSAADITIAGSQICAGGEKGKDSCQGDSGGPLMYRHRAENEENWFCIGVVSFGLAKCGIEHVPGVYTRVTEFLPWIFENIKP